MVLQEIAYDKLVCFSSPNGKGNVMQVCRITQRIIETLTSGKKEGEVMYTEKHGNMVQKSKFAAANVDLITDHVSSFPRDESHYGRTEISKEYLSQDLNISRLYLAFKETPRLRITFITIRSIVHAQILAPNVTYYQPKLYSKTW